MECWSSSSEIKKHIFTNLKKLGIQPSKFRGQNFLIDSEIIKFQIQRANIQHDDIILEIGGGLGSLTKCLLSKAKRVYVIESNSILARFLSDFTSTHQNIEIIYGDAVKTEFPVFTKCVSNLPYQISSPITFKILDSSFDIAILMYQKEFADRIIAKPGEKNYSRLSVAMNLLANCSYLRTIEPNAFYPQPKIFSSLVLISKKRNTKIRDYKEFMLFNTHLFNNKKKIVRSNLANLLKRKRKEQISFDATLLEGIPYSNRRIFTLTLDEIIKIYNYIKEKIEEDAWFNIISLNTK
ncbi:MAG: 16S rRNA (adenine(1518)-N(6)/adenine(1519)-N(6))-dimethyltransferase RsmA [Candidatus Heimdallarchaeaceae archaeon]